MRQLVLVGVLALVVQLHAVDKKCFKLAQSQCSSQTKAYEPCSALFSGIEEVMGDLQDFVLQHILDSHNYLMISANFGYYKRQREGFSKLFKKLSDDTWEDAIDTIKYITKRGGSMDFNKLLPEKVPSTPETSSLELTEPESISLAIDMYKNLIKKAYNIHNIASKRSSKVQNIHDPELISFIENKFVGKHTDIIRDLVGHYNDVMRLIHSSNNRTDGDNPAGLSIYLFDEHLKTVS